MDVVGFVKTRKGATTIMGAVSPDQFIGQTCAVMEFCDDGGALILNPEGTALAMINKEDILTSFECSVEGGVVAPPNLSFFEKHDYIAKCFSRKGGYNSTLKAMVVENSLMKGKFCDSFIWAKQ